MGFFESIAPQYAVKRARARFELDRIEYTQSKIKNLGKRDAEFEGASSGRRLANWIASNSGPAGSSTFALEALRNRSRDLRRNNPFMANYVEGPTTNMIGTGIRAQICDAHAKHRRSKKIDPCDLWAKWAESTDCDADGRHDFYGLQALVTRTLIESGEVLIRRRYRRANDGLSTSLQLQVLEPDYLCDRRVISARGKNTVSNGIEFDRKGKRVAYHLYTEHPGSQKASVKVVRVPARDIAHVFRVDRPGQTRGVPWVAPVLSRMRLLDDYQDAALERARVSACFAAFVTEPDLGGLPGSVDEETGFDRVEPGMIERLPPGHDVKFGSPPSTSDYPEFVRSVLRSIAAGLGTQYEILTSDLSQVNFSSARMGFIEFQRRIDSWRWQTVIPLFCEQAFSWWRDVAEIEHGIPHVHATWTPPRREMIDPAKEIPGQVSRIRAGLASWSEVVREEGYDPDTLLAEIKEYQDKADELGVVFDTDVRKISAAGQAQKGSENDDPSKSKN